MGEPALDKTHTLLPHSFCHTLGCAVGRVLAASRRTVVAKAQLVVQMACAWRGEAGGSSTPGRRRHCSSTQAALSLSSRCWWVSPTGGPLQTRSLSRHSGCWHLSVSQVACRTHLFKSVWCLTLWMMGGWVRQISKQAGLGRRLFADCWGVFLTNWVI